MYPNNLLDNKLLVKNSKQELDSGADSKLLVGGVLGYSDIDTVSRKWNLLTTLGPQLRNTKNNCWFHALLVFLAQIGEVREKCVLGAGCEGLKGLVSRSILAVCGLAPSGCLAQLFEHVKDFSGVQNRYKQNSAADFLDFIVLKVPTIFSGFTTYANTLQCRDCRWISIKDSTEPTFKLYFRDAKAKNVTLQGLITQNSVSLLGKDNKAFCGQCSRSTSQSVSRSFSGKVVILELMRVTLSRHGFRKKCSTNVTFSLNGYVTLPGSVEKFRVIAVCHHKGGVNSGHWYSGITLKNGNWFTIDDLKSAHLPIVSVGMSTSNTVTLLLLLAESMLS